MLSKIILSNGQLKSGNHIDKNQDEEIGLNKSALRQRLEKAQFLPMKMRDYSI